MGRASSRRLEGFVGLVCFVRTRFFAERFRVAAVGSVLAVVVVVVSFDELSVV